MASAPPPTQVWYRNPVTYIREVAELGVNYLAWDRGLLRKKGIDPAKHADLHLPASLDYRILVIGDQGNAELRRGRDLSNPVAVYPAWEYGLHSADELVEMLCNPAGEDEELCSDTSLPPDERPVRGQEHRVVILRTPNVASGPGRKFLRLLQELQEEFPESIIHLHGVYSYRAMFGCGLRAADVDSRARAGKGDVELPNGRNMPWEKAVKTNLQWINLLGFKASDLSVARNRCMYNMKAAIWAAEHWNDNLAFKSREVGLPTPVDPTSPTHVPATTIAIKSKALSPNVGDKFLCDLCSLQNTCKYFRSGGVCSIPETEPAPLAAFFKTRDADLIIDGLGTLLAAQTRRLEMGMENEVEEGEINGEVTKIISSLFNNGVKLAKLVDPKLAAAGATKVNMNQINMGGAAAATPQAFMASVVAEIEKTGVKREDITEEMVMTVINATQPAAITATASASSE